MITNTVLKARVARGIEWINSHPEYQIDLDRVNLETLKTVIPQHCVLGQGYTGPIGYGTNIYSGYGAVRDRLYHEFGSNDRAWNRMSKFLIDHGFNVSDDDGWDRLDLAWREALVEQAQT